MRNSDRSRPRCQVESQHFGWRGSASITGVGATEVVALIGVAGTVVAALLTQWFQASAAERTARLAHLMEMQSALYVDALEYAQWLHDRLIWVTANPDERPRSSTRPSAPSSAATVGPRMEVFAPQPILNAWVIMVTAHESLEHGVEMAGNFHERGGAVLTSDDPDVVLVQKAIDRLGTAIRRDARVG